MWCYENGVNQGKTIENHARQERPKGSRELRQVPRSAPEGIELSLLDPGPVLIEVELSPLHPLHFPA
jgi:hypothetical protein